MDQIIYVFEKGLTTPQCFSGNPNNCRSLWGNHIPINTEYIIFTKLETKIEIISHYYFHFACLRNNSCSLDYLSVVKTYKTFFSQLLVVNQFAVPQVVEDGTKVCGISVNDIGSGLILLQRQRHKQTFMSFSIYILHETSLTMVLFIFIKFL